MMTAKAEVCGFESRHLDHFKKNRHALFFSYQTQKLSYCHIVIKWCIMPLYRYCINSKQGENMTNSKAYMAGFCKVAEDAGVDPVELMKYAGLWDSIKGGFNKVTGAIGNGVKAMGNAVANSGFGQKMKQMGSSIANSSFGQGMKQYGQGMMGFGKNMLQGNFGAAMNSYGNAAKGFGGAMKGAVKGLFSSGQNTGKPSTLQYLVQGARQRKFQAGGAGAATGSFNS